MGKSDGSEYLEKIGIPYLDLAEVLHHCHFLMDSIRMFPKMGPLHS